MQKFLNMLYSWGNVFENDRKFFEREENYYERPCIMHNTVSPR